MSFRHDFIVNTWIGEWTNTWYLLIQLKQERQAPRGHVILQPLTLPSHVLISYQVCSSWSNGWRWWLRVTGPAADPVILQRPCHHPPGDENMLAVGGNGCFPGKEVAWKHIWQTVLPSFGSQRMILTKYSLPHLSQRWIPQSMPISKLVT